MDTQTQAQIYLSEQRGCSQSDYVRSYHCFNFGSYSDDSRQPFGCLQLVNDDMLKAQHAVCMLVEDDTDVLIIPIAGGIEYTSPVGSGFIEPGQCQVFSLRAGMAYELINPYETEVINYVTIWLKRPFLEFEAETGQRQFDLAVKNQLLPVYATKTQGSVSACKGFIGRYDGRCEEEYRPDSQGVFVFVISGVFEVQSRLLHERDGLALTNSQDGLVDFEALSNDAILLLLDVPLSDVPSEMILS